jgi:multidrug efflux system membrane fusion protein
MRWPFSQDRDVRRAAPACPGAVRVALGETRPRRIAEALIRRAVPTACIAALVAAACSKTANQPQRAAVPVTVKQAVRAAVPYTIQANGLVMPTQLAQVAPQVDGIITHVDFREGDDVTRGQALFQIEPSPYQAAYEQALAALARDSATAENDEREVFRYNSLVKQDFVTHEQADQIRATAAAAVATVKSDRASVQTAAFNLRNTTVRAPIEGRTGALLVREGNLVHAAQNTPLVVINQIKPILVRFAVPGTDLPLIQRYSSKSTPLAVTAVPSTPSSSDTTTPSGAPGDPTGNSAYASSDTITMRPLPSVPPALGNLFFIDNAVDTTTGTITLKASFANTGGTLWAGEFVATSLQLFTEQNALVVPAQAVQTGQQGTYVYVVDSTGVARQRPVSVERVAGQVTVIASGLTQGERVVTDGQSRLTPGAKVSILTSAAAVASPSAAKPGAKSRRRASQ